MQQYAQNNFKDSAIAKEGKVDVVMLVAAVGSITLMFCAFINAFGG